MSVWRWSLDKKVRRVRRAVCRPLYVDRNPDPGRTAMILGAARSGTTWVADLLASQVRCRIMFEPFNTRLIPAYAEYNYYQYMRPTTRDSELEAYVSRVVTGRIRDRWIDRQVETLLPDYRVVKAVRGCLMARWIHERFPEVPIVLLIRHPCAVVASRMKLGWATDQDIAPFLSQNELLEDVLGPKMGVIGRARTDSEKHAVVWSITNLVPLLQFRDARLNVLFFEDLVTSPRAVIPALFAATQMPYRDSVFEHHQRPSTTARQWSASVRGAPPSASWRRDLSEKQIDAVMRVVRDFELDSLYGPQGTPTGRLPGGASRLFDSDSHGSADAS